MTSGYKTGDNAVKPYATVLFGTKCHGYIFFYKVVEKEEGENMVMELWCNMGRGIGICVAVTNRPQSLSG